MRKATLFTALISALALGCTETAQRDAPIVVRDDAGAEVRLGAPAQRIVSLVPAATELIVALGAADRLVARTEFDRQPALAHLPSVGGGLTPNLEWIAGRRPDLVISWPDHSTRSLAARLAQLDIAVYGARSETLADAARTTRTLALLLGREAAADSLLQRIGDELEQVRRAVAGRAPVSVLYVISLEPPMVAGPDNFIDELIRIAGGSNAFADAATAWPQISLEEAVRRDPDLVILALGGPEEGQVARLRQAPGWREVPAVRAGRTIYANADDFNRWGPGLPATARRLARIFHPAAIAADSAQ